MWYNNGIIELCKKHTSSGPESESELSSFLLALFFGILIKVGYKINLLAKNHYCFGVCCTLNAKLFPYGGKFAG